MTNREFLTQKRDNFIKFCSEALNKNKRINKEKNAKFNDKLEQLRTLNVELFITAIVENMINYKDHPEDYVIKMLKEEGLDKTDLTAEELAKAGRFILCFVTIVSS